MPEYNAIIKLSKQHLDKDGQEAIADFLLENKVTSAKIYLLGAIDSGWTNKQINDNEAAEAYKALGIDSEKASKLRQDSSLWK